MNILVIDTSTGLEFLTVSANGKIYQFCEDAGQSHSVTMFQNISDLLAQASIGIRDIGLLGVGTGPGSFTGIRIAVSTARMFSQILGIPIVGIKSQEIFAASAVSYPDKTVLVAFDAKKLRVFAGVYRVEKSTISEIIEPGDYTMTEILSLIKNPGEMICIGDGCLKYLDVIEKTSQINNFTYRYLKDFTPEGRDAANLTLKKYEEAPEKYADFNETVPFYTRKSDAETAKYGR